MEPAQMLAEMLPFPWDVFEIVLTHCSTFARARISITRKNILIPIWRNVTQFTFDRKNVNDFTAFFAAVHPPQLRSVVLKRCFFPLELGVPEFMKQLTSFTWIVGKINYLTLPELSLLEWFATPRAGDRKILDSPEWVTRQLKHLEDCLAALDPTQLTAITLDNSEGQSQICGRACIPFFEKCCKMPMLNAKRVKIRHVLNGHMYFIFLTPGFTERLCKHWSMPNLEELEVDCDMDLLQELEKNAETLALSQIVNDWTLRPVFRLWGPIIRRINPNTLQRVKLSGLTSILNVSPYLVGRGLPSELFTAVKQSTASELMAAFVAWSGQDYNKFETHKHKCLCRAFWACQTWSSGPFVHKRFKECRHNDED